MTVGRQENEPETRQDKPRPDQRPEARPDHKISHDKKGKPRPETKRDTGALQERQDKSKHARVVRPCKKLGERPDQTGTSRPIQKGL
jgi:hypothetical protein